MELFQKFVSYLADKCSVATRRALRVAPPLPTPAPSSSPGSGTTRRFSVSWPQSWRILLISFSKGETHVLKGQVTTKAVHILRLVICGSEHSIFRVHSHTFCLSDTSVKLELNMDIHGIRPAQRQL